MFPVQVTTKPRGWTLATCSAKTHHFDLVGHEEGWAVGLGLHVRDVRQDARVHGEARHHLRHTEKPLLRARTRTRLNSHRPELQTDIRRVQSTSYHALLLSRAVEVLLCVKVRGATDVLLKRSGLQQEYTNGFQNKPGSFWCPSPPTPSNKKIWTQHHLQCACERTVSEASCAALVGVDVALA